MWVVNIFFLTLLVGGFLVPVNSLVCGFGMDLLFVGLWGVLIIVLLVWACFTVYGGNFFFTSLYLYFVGFLKTIIFNPTGCYNVLLSNWRIFFMYSRYIVRSLWSWCGVYYHVWRPVFKRSGYAFLLNSSRARWSLSQSHNFYKNK